MLATGASGGVFGWITSDAAVGLIGAMVAVLGFLVMTFFKYLESKDRHNEVMRQIDRLNEEEARAKEMHTLRMRLLKDSLDNIHAGRAVINVSEKINDT
jgi:trans-2-enoyl-CoA reductase